MVLFSFTFKVDYDEACLMNCSLSDEHDALQMRTMTEHWMIFFSYSIRKLSITN